MSDAVYPVLPGSTIDVDREVLTDTTIQRESSGRELRIRRASSARYRYSITYDFLRQDHENQDELDELMGFFSQHRGAWDSFLFTDPKDDSVGSAAFGIGDGTTAVFYLRDDYGDRIGACNSTPLVFAAGVLQVSGAGYTLDSGSGKITFAAAPAAAVALTWTGRYYRRVRFETDRLRTKRRFSRVWRADVSLLSVVS